MSSWRSLVLRLGEKCSEYDGITEHKDQLEICLGVVCSELSESGDEILSFLLQCAEGLPHKAPLYGTLVGLINLEDEDFARKALDNVHGSLQDALHDGNCNRIRVLMRFLTTLMCSKVLQPASLIVLFETLISAAATTVDEEKGNPCWQSCADFYIISVLSCLPWGGAELFEQVPVEIDRVMVGIQAYMSIRKHISDAGYSVFNYIDDRTQEDDEKDFLEDLWGRIQDLSNKEWRLDSVPRPHLSFEDQLGAGKSYDFGLVNCPELPDPPMVSSLIACGKQKHEADLKYPLRIRRLQIFPASKTGDLQPIDCFIMEEYLLDVLLFLNGCRKECASSMVGLPVPFRYEYLMAETIFSQILLLPHSPFKPVYYTLVIMDLCKALPGAFPAVVASAVRSLFNKISDLDMECRNRLVLWFSHHLSNFQFIWPWEEWSHVLDLPKWAPQRVFVQEVLEREVRLSYWDRIKQSIESAPVLEELLPPKGTPNFIYTGEDGDQTERDLSSELSRMVKERTLLQEMLKWVEEQVLPAHGLDVTLRVVAQTLLNIGSKSFTHLITVLERFGQIFSRICSDDDKQIMLINEVNYFWKNNAQMTAICIDRMMGYRIVSNVAIIRWVFSELNVDQFHISDRPWEILRNSVSKTFNRIADLKKEISSLRKGVESAAKAASKAVNELEDFKSKLTLTLVNGEPVLDENPVKMKRMNLNIERTKAAEISTRESLESKEVLLGQAITELQELLLLLFKSFARVLAERIEETDGLLNVLGEKDEMAVDQEDTSIMDFNADDEQQDKSHPNGEKPKNGYNLGEKEQWCLSTLGYVKAITRQYASEIWPLVEKLDAEVLTEDVHPLFRDAVYSGLCRPIAS